MYYCFTEKTVLKTAFLGRAALNIFGQTIHSAFKLPLHLQLPYIPLAEDKLNTLRVNYGKLQLLIVDEISMVSKAMLIYISGRLGQIKGKREPFGGVSVLCSGDFYQLPPVKGANLIDIDPGALPQELWTNLN